MREVIELLEGITDEHGTDCLICYQHPHREQCPIGKALTLLRAKPKADGLAEIGERYMEIYERNIPEDYHPANCPTEWLLELLSDSDASRAENEKHRWIPVGERLPKAGHCLVLCEGHVYEVEIRVSNDEWEDAEGNISYADTAKCIIEHLGCVLIGHDECITHWKPIILPEQALKETP